MEALEQAEKEAREHAKEAREQARDKAKQQTKTHLETEDLVGEGKRVEANAAVNISSNEETTGPEVSTTRDENLEAAGEEITTSPDSPDTAHALLEPDCFGVSEP
jgi:hypothetical protein